MTIKPDILVKGKKDLASIFKFWSPAPLRHLGEERDLGNIRNHKISSGRDRFQGTPENKYYYISDKGQVYNLRDIDEASPFIDGFDDADITKLFVKISSGVKKDLIPPTAVVGVGGASTIFSVIAAIITNEGLKSARINKSNQEVTISTKIKEELQKHGVDVQTNKTKELIDRYRGYIQKGGKPNEEIEEHLEEYKSIKLEHRAIWCMDRAVKGALIIGLVELAAFIIILSLGITIPSNPFTQSAGLTEAILGGVVSIAGALMLIPAVIALAGQVQMCYHQSNESREGKEEVISEKQKNALYRNNLKQITKDNNDNNNVNPEFLQNINKLNNHLDKKITSQKEGVTNSSRIFLAQGTMAIGSILTIIVGVMVILNLTGVLTFSNSLTVGIGITGGVLSFIGGVGTIVYSVKNSFAEIDNKKTFEIRKQHDIATDKIELFDGQGKLNNNEYKKLESFIKDYQDNINKYKLLSKEFNNCSIPNDSSYIAYYQKEILRGYDNKGIEREIYKLNTDRIFRDLNINKHEFVGKICRALGTEEKNSLEDTLANIFSHKYSNGNYTDDKKSLVNAEREYFIECLSKHHITNKRPINLAFNLALKDWVKASEKNTHPELLLNQIIISKLEKIHKNSSEESRVHHHDIATDKIKLFDGQEKSNSDEQNIENKKRGGVCIYNPVNNNSINTISVGGAKCNSPYENQKNKPFLAIFPSHCLRKSNLLLFKFMMEEYKNQNNPSSIEHFKNFIIEELNINIRQGENEIDQINKALEDYLSGEGNIRFYDKNNLTKLQDNITNNISDPVQSMLCMGRDIRKLYKNDGVAQNMVKLFPTIEDYEEFYNMFFTKYMSDIQKLTKNSKLEDAIKHAYNYKYPRILYELKVSNGININRNSEPVIVSECSSSDEPMQIKNDDGHIMTKYNNDLGIDIYKRGDSLYVDFCKLTKYIHYVGTLGLFQDKKQMMKERKVNVLGGGPSSCPAVFALKKLFTKNSGTIGVEFDCTGHSYPTNDNLSIQCRDLLKANNYSSIKKMLDDSNYWINQNTNVNETKKIFNDLIKSLEEDYQHSYSNVKSYIEENDGVISIKTGGKAGPELIGRLFDTYPGELKSVNVFLNSKLESSKTSSKDFISQCKKFLNDLCLNIDLQESDWQKKIPDYSPSWSEITKKVRFTSEHGTPYR